MDDVLKRRGDASSLAGKVLGFFCVVIIFFYYFFFLVFHQLNLTAKREIAREGGRDFITGAIFSLERNTLSYKEEEKDAEGSGAVLQGEQHNTVCVCRVREKGQRYRSWCPAGV